MMIIMKKIENDENNENDNVGIMMIHNKGSIKSYIFYVVMIENVKKPYDDNGRTGRGSRGS